MPNRFSLPPPTWPDPLEHARKIALAVRGLMRGESNNVERATLTVNTTETVLTVDRCGPDSVAILVPLTSSAAASVASVYTVCGFQQVTIYHDSSSATNRTFGLVIVG